MAKKVLLSAGVGILLGTFLFIHDAAGADMDDGSLLFDTYGIDVNASVGYIMPTKDDLENAFYFRLGSAYQLSDSFSLGASVGIYNVDVSSTWDPDRGEHPPERGLSDGDLEVIPLVAEARYRHDAPEMMGTFTAIFGVGYYFIDYSMNGKSINYFSQNPNSNLLSTQDISSTVGVNLGAGYEYPLSARLSLDMSCQYIYLDPKIEVDWYENITGDRWHSADITNRQGEVVNASNVPEDYSMSSWLISIGVRVIF